MFKIRKAAVCQTANVRLTRLARVEHRRDGEAVALRGLDRVGRVLKNDGIAARRAERRAAIPSPRTIYTAQKRTPHSVRAPFFSPVSR